MDEFSVLKSVFQKHNEDGSVDETVGEIVYDAQAVSPNDMLLDDNGDIFVFGFTIDDMNSPDELFAIKYTSDITDVKNVWQSNITLSPNPSSSTRWILKGESIDIKEVKMFDISGRYLLDLEVDQNQVYTNHKVDSGLYVLSIITTQGEIINTKLLIH